jgi:ribonuclease HIII
MSQESKKQTAVELLAERYNKLALMRSREEISASLAVEWLENFLEESKKMEKQQIIDAYAQGFIESESMDKGAEQYYTETYGKQQNG